MTIHTPPVRRVAAIVVWNYAARMIDAAGMFITSALIARFLGAAANGIFAGLLGVSQLGLALANFGLEAAAQRFVVHPGTGQSPASLLRKILGLRSITAFCGGIAAGAVLFVSPIAGISATPGYASVLGGYVLARSLVMLITVIVVSQYRSTIYLAVAPVVRIVEFIGVLWIGTTAPSPLHFLVLFACTGILQLLLTLLPARGLFRAPAAVDVPMRPVMTFSMIFWINTIVDFFLGRFGDIFFLGRLQADQQVVGYYDAASVIHHAGSLILTAGLTGIVLPTFARLYAVDAARTDRFYQFTVRLFSILLLPVFVFMLWNSTSVVGAVYGASFLPAVPLLQGLLLARILARLVGGGENADYLLTLDKPLVVSSIGLLAAAINITGDIGLIPRWGAMGAVVATGSASLLSNVATFIFLSRKRPVALQPLYWGKVVLASVGAAALASLVQSGDSPTQLLLRIAVFIPASIALLVVLKPFARDDAAMAEAVSPMLKRAVPWLVRNHEAAP